MVIGLVVLMAVISFAAGVGFTQRYWEDSHQWTEHTIEATKWV